MAENSSESLYKAKSKIYPREIKGRFQNLRKLAVLALLGLFYLLPWLSINGQQAILFDLPARKFHIFGLTFWPQDFFLLALLLIIAAVTLFFFTALAGRLWCGYACPQTVWTEVFIWIEQRIEGSRNQQMRLDKAPMSARKFRIKFTKHSVWILFALWTGFTFVGFFSPIRDLGIRVMDFDLGGWETFWMLFYAFATWGNAGFLREQVCLYMCPYARFQSAMFDKDTLIITYDPERGEPRGHRKKSADRDEITLGDCIDCHQCVQVCPTGIDIRDGLQYECIACAACVDVCDEVMDKMNYPRGLIRYATENGMEGQQKHILRPRTIIYAMIWLLLLGGFAFAVGNRSTLTFDILRDRNALYRVVNDQIENVYTLKIVNKTDQDSPVTLTAHGLPDYQITTRPDPIVALSGNVTEVIVSLSVPASQVRGGVQEFTFQLQGDAIDVEEPTRFIGPLPK